MSSTVVTRKVIIQSLKRQPIRLAAAQQLTAKPNVCLVRQYHQLSQNVSKLTASSNNEDAIKSLLNFRAFSDKPADEESKKDGDNETLNEDTKEETSEAKEEEEGPSEVEKLQAEVKNMKDQLLRSLAEQENIRRIAKKDVDNAKAFAITSFAKSLLDTSDNLTRALDAVPEEYREDKENHAVLATLFEGIKMTDDGLTKAFAKNGLTKFGAVGDKFDPNMHEALFEYVDENAEAGSIGQVMKVGFSLKKRVIRPAEVGVIKSP